MGVLGDWTFKYFYPGEGEGEHTHETPPPAVVAPVIDTGNELVAPVVDHAEKITRIEERQAQHQEEMFRELRGLEERLVTATGSQISRIEERISQVEGRIAAQAEGAGVPDESVELTLPEVEASPAPPEKIRQGMSHRRKAKRKGKAS